MSLELGIFSETYRRTDAEAAAAALAADGFTVTQYNWPSAGIPELPDPQRPPDYGSIRAAYVGAGVSVAAVSATYNMIHPDPAVRRRGTAAAADVISRAPELGAAVATLCTGTRNDRSMWRAHPDNTSDAAWKDLRASLDALVPVAAAAGIRLGIEPEPSNVITDVDRVLRLFTELGPDARHLTVVMDPANLLAPETLSTQDAVLTRAFAELGDRVCCVHAKDLLPTGGFGAPGTGGLDYDLVVRLQHGLPTTVPLIIQDTLEDDVARVLGLLRRSGA